MKCPASAKLIADGLWVDLRRGKYDPIHQLIASCPSQTRADADHVSCLPAGPTLAFAAGLAGVGSPRAPAHHVSAVDALDLTAFYATYEGDGRRKAPYEPSMMVKS